VLIIRVFELVISISVVVHVVIFGNVLCLALLILLIQLLQVGSEFAARNLATELEQEVTLTLALRERVTSD
jgi:hypothetical protein